MGVAGTAPKMQGVGAWSQRTAGRPGGRQRACAAKMLVGDPEPTPQRQKLPLPIVRDSSGWENKKTGDCCAGLVQLGNPKTGG